MSARTSSPRRSAVPSTRSAVRIPSRSPVRSPSSPRRSAPSYRRPSPRSPVVEDFVEEVLELGPYQMLTAELEAHGWVPVGEVVTEDDLVHYVKAVTPQGYEGYVLIDGQGDMVRHDGTVYRVVSNSDALVKSVSYKSSAMKVGENCGCGVALVCTDGICMMNRNPETMEVEETNFAVVSPVGTDYGVEGDNVLPIPIVYFSDIVRDHALQEKKVMDAQIAHTLESFRSCMKSQEEMIDAHSVFDRLAELHKEQYGEAWGNLLKSIKNRREVRSGYPGDLSQMETNQSNLLRAVSSDLSNRNEMVQALLRACSQAQAAKRYLEKLNDNLAKQILYLKEHYSEEALRGDIQ